MKRNAKIVVALVVTLLVILGVVVGVSKRNSVEKIAVVATNFPAYDFVRAVADDKAEVKMLVKPGAETHDFEPSPGDIIDIQKSKLFVYTGGESDEWIEDVLDDIDAGKVKMLKMMDAVKVVEEEVVSGMEGDEHDNEHEHHDEGKTEYDEHVWTSLRNASKIVESIKEELVKISPENREEFEQNAKKYTEKLAELDRKFREIVEAGERKVVVFGDRFPLRYFVDDYGLEYYAAFPGCSEQTEASSRTVAFLVDKVKTEKIPVVFAIEMGNGELARTIANEAGAKVLTFNALHNVSLDDFKNGRTYVEMMEENLDVLEEALR